MNKQWWKESVVYQIYPRSFKDSNGDGIGDLQGVIEKLEYLKELGIDVIWLSPIYQSPNDDNGYDISDYQTIMKEFGTMTDFEDLVKKAHELELKIMMDLVVNHTSDEHKWFINSSKSKENPYRDYYIWREGKGLEPPNHWESFFGGSAWQYDTNTDMYYLHLFSKKQPDLNWENPKVRQSVYEMMHWWIGKGVDGFRMDVINFISKTEGLPEGEPIPNTPYTEKEEHIVCGPHMHEYLKEMNESVLSHYDIMTVGETPSISIEEARIIAGQDSNELQMVFQFEHMDIENEGNNKWTNCRFELSKLKKILSKWQYGLNDTGWNSLYWNNHDQPRVVSRFGNDQEYWSESAKMLATCLHMLKGTPYIYQGEEIGMTNIALDNISNYKDIETLNAYKKYTEELGISKEVMMSCIHSRSRDNARTPMQWDDSRHGGFTDGQPWFNINKAYQDINVKSQRHDPNSIFSYYKELIRLRKEWSIIVYGEYKLLEVESEEIYVYTRKLNKETLLVICNFANQTIEYTIPINEVSPNEPILLCSNYIKGEYEVKMQLKPYEGTVYLYQLD